jgi:tRNA G18 (ribose-2'-O)-methylase SpoU
LRLEEISDPGDPRLANYRDLKDSVLRRRAERAERVFVVEGKLALEAVLASTYPLLSVLVLRRRLGALAQLALPPETPIYVVGDEVMGGIAGFNVHRGLLAIARRVPATSAAELLARGPGSPLVVVEGVNDQENLGAIFRNAAAFGAGAVLLDPTCADPLYRRCVRVSLGTVLKVPFARLEPWPESLELFRDDGFVALALTPDPGADRIEDVGAELHGAKVALVVGAEGHGLTPEVLSSCRRARIPMAKRVDSLNVAAATAVALHRFASPALR